MRDGESVNLAAVTTSLHVGTHADAPLHVQDGWPASEALAVDAFLGEAVVIAVDADHPGPIDVRDVQALVAEALGAGADAVTPARGAPMAWPTRLLLRTGRSTADGMFPDDWPVLTEDAAVWLVSVGLRLWGVDAPSVDVRTSKTLPVHHALLGRGAFVLENLDLRAVPPGRYELIAPPLAVEGADAAPVRALLRAVR